MKSFENIFNQINRNIKIGLNRLFIVTKMVIIKINKLLIKKYRKIYLQAAIFQDHIRFSEK